LQYNIVVKKFYLPYALYPVSIHKSVPFRQLSGKYLIISEDSVTDPNPFCQICIQIRIGKKFVIQIRICICFYGTISLKSVWGSGLGWKFRYKLRFANSIKNIKRASLKATVRFSNQGGSRCKTGFTDLQDLEKKTLAKTQAWLANTTWKQIPAFLSIQDDQNSKKSWIQL
jgi:hypothetical protein